MLRQGLAAASARLNASAGAAAVSGSREAGRQGDCKGMRIVEALAELDTGARSQSRRWGGGAADCSQEGTCRNALLDSVQGVADSEWQKERSRGHKQRRAAVPLCAVAR